MRKREGRESPSRGVLHPLDCVQCLWVTCGASAALWGEVDAGFGWARVEVPTFLYHYMEEVRRAWKLNDSLE